MSLYVKERSSSNDSIFSSRNIGSELSKYKMPEKESDPRVIAELVKDELFLDGNARQNLATFCQTYLEKEVHELMDLSISKNMIDKDEYPQSAEIEKRCVQILADLWHTPDEARSIGTSTVGSSEACMLGGLAMYYRWREKRKKEGKDYSYMHIIYTAFIRILKEKEKLNRFVINGRRIIYRIRKEFIRTKISC